MSRSQRMGLVFIIIGMAGIDHSAATLWPGLGALLCGIALFVPDAPAEHPLTQEGERKPNLSAAKREESGK
jgi:hypothetical protein